MKKNNKKPIIFMAIMIVACIAIGSTLAYYTSNDTFVNEFETGTYEVETSEIFESPDNWTPGTTTPKKVKVKNNGSVPVAVFVSFYESWQDAQGNPLPIKDSQNRPAAIINYSENYDSYWNHSQKDYLYNGAKYNYFYYIVALEEGESTIDLIDSVTFNPDVTISSTNNCVTDDTTHETVCTTSYGGYSGGKYTLRISVKTVQYDQYRTLLDPTFGISSSDTNFERMLKVGGATTEVFGRTMDRLSIEKVITVNNKNIPNDAIASWDASQMNDGSAMAWITDVDNDNKYELYLGANGGVVANVFNRNLFANYRNVEVMDLTYFDTSRVESMYYMFAGVGQLADSFDFIGIENLNTSKVKDLTAVFMTTGGDGKTYDFSNWDVSNVTESYGVFAAAHFTYTGTDNWTFLN